MHISFTWTYSKDSVKESRPCKIRLPVSLFLREGSDTLRSNFPSREYGRQGGDSDIHSGQLVFPVHNNFGEALDSRDEGHPVDSAYEWQIPH